MNSCKNTASPIFCGGERTKKPAVRRNPATPAEKARQREDKKERSRLIKRCYLTDMRSSAQDTLATLYSFANKDTDSLFNPNGQWHCFPTVAAIAKRAKLSVSTIHKHLHLLSKAGYINYRNRYRMCRKTDQYRQASNVYYLVSNKIETESYIMLKRLEAMRGAVSAAVRAGKSIVRKAIPKALTYGKKQESIEPSFFANKNQTGHTQWRYDEANQETDRLLREAKANKSADPQSHIQKLKALFKGKPHRNMESAGILIATASN